MSKRPLGPGPGAYMLPPTVGYENHDNRKQRMPQYSFGTRSYRHEKLLGPGAGAYKVDTLTRYGVSTSNQFTIQGRTYVKEKNIGPGPGAHDVHLKPFFKGTDAPAYSMSWRNAYAFKSSTPGPNAYGVDVSPIKQAFPAYSMGIRCGLTGKALSPGPAAYGAGNLSVKLPRSPEFSISGRNPYSYKKIGPGPNNYNLIYYRPGKSGQAYSFGIRHNDFAPPMIVKCDNM
ncbi:outer dense fiber protein 3-like protein 2 [Anastrepha obliqua]|uniref:outer dense fiber protein 3-like protein 2 n=1 Tax=Anastrepha obliqua TaxID=95512 RepID=UPI00240A7811|nr:outer dense fiber protein 3-like protein 2 [Anastrepha obliqua]